MEDWGFVLKVLLDLNVYSSEKCLPVLLYGTEVCPTNAADLQAMQFTINREMIKLSGTMSQNYYQEVSNYFGINTVKN